MPDGAWMLVTLRRNPGPEDHGPAIVRRPAMGLGMPCALFDANETLDRPSTAVPTFGPDATRLRSFGVDPSGPSEDE